MRFVVSAQARKSLTGPTKEISRPVEASSREEAIRKFLYNISLDGWNVPDSSTIEVTLGGIQKDI